MTAHRPARSPLGLELSRTARAVTNAIERAMAEAGGSLSIWQVLLLVRTKQWATQSEMADAMGITGATLTHHLNAAEAQGLVRRWREPGNRRVQRVELTPAGVAMFDKLKRVAGGHDERLRSQLTDQQVEELGALLEKVRGSIESPGC